MKVQYYGLRFPPQVPMCKSLRDTSGRLAELGWLHNKVRKYTDSRSLDRAFGLVGQVWMMSPFFLVTPNELSFSFPCQMLLKKKWIVNNERSNYI